MTTVINNLIQDLTTLGTNHIGTNTNETGEVQGLRRNSNNLFDRIINWLKGGTGQKNENRAALDYVKAQVTANLGPRYAEVFQTQVQRSFDSIRPIAGMKIAHALQEVKELKSREDVIKIREAKEQNKTLIETLAPTIQKFVDTQCARYGLTADEFNMDSLKTLILGRLDRKSEDLVKSLNPEIPEENAEIESIISGKVNDQVRSDSRAKYARDVRNLDPSIESMLSATLTERGIETKVSKVLIEGIKTKAAIGLYNGSLHSHGKIVPASPEDVKATVTRYITTLAKTLDEIKNTALPPATQEALQKAILNSDSVTSLAAMKITAHTLASGDNLEKISKLFALNKTTANITSLKDELLSIQQDFADAWEEQEKAGFMIGGDDKLDIAKIIMGTVAYSTQDDGKIDFGRMGALYLRTSYDLQLEIENIIQSGKDSQIGHNGEVGFAKFLLDSFAGFHDTSVNSLINQNGKLPPTMLHKNDLEAIETANNRASSFQSFFSIPGNENRKEAMRADIERSMARQPEGDFATFKADFARQFTITVDGEPIKNTAKSSDPLTQLLAAFNGDQNVMEKVLAFANQGSFADLFIEPSAGSIPELLTFSDPDENTQVINQTMKADILHNDDGSCTIKFSGCLQTTVAGLSAISELRISNFYQPIPTVELIDFDFCLTHVAKADD